ncbi:MAG TPA: enoyl-CoA hydratase [Planctomycetes bacterium]|nr:enoyl-CoA hydratase [Planctomycetota bacterium]
MPEVLAERRGARLTLTLSAPERGNSLDEAMLSALEGHLRAAASDDELRLVLLRGAGERSFSTGYHVPSLLAELDQGPSVSDYENHPLERALRALEELPQPSLAAIGGNAYGAGCELALACDLRVASEEARFCMPPAKLGVLYSATGMRRLLELVGPSRTKELLFTACVIDAARAERIGLADRVAPSEAFWDEVERTASAIEGNAPLSIRHTKTILRSFLAPPPLDEAALAEVARLRDECFRSEEFRRRSAKLGKRSR